MTINRKLKLNKSKSISFQIIRECKARLGLDKMTYPEGLVMNRFDGIDYKGTIELHRETIKNINRLLEEEKAK